MPKRPRNKPPRHPQKQRPDHSGSPHLSEISVLLITGTNEHGELLAEPLKWEARRKPPHIIVTESGRSRAAVKGDKVLAKLRKIKPNFYQALVIRVLPGEQPRPVLGVFTATSDGGIIEPVSRKMKESFMVAHKDALDARHGELVSGITLPGIPSIGMSYAKITERLGRIDSPKAASLIAANIHELPQVFSDAAVAESEEAPLPTLTSQRKDLRQIPLVTIDGEDARDFDDAVFAEPDTNPKNKGGFHLIVAIADVAFYVTPDSALDKDAFERGNSVYFPDRVIPMLPERLSNGLCSLVPDEDRYCVAVHIWINARGEMLHYEFVRALMRSHYRFTYHDMQAVYDMKSNHPLRTKVVEPLFAAYALLAAERDRRGALDLNLPEYKIMFDSVGNVEAIMPRARLESHRLIEAFMIAANVAAADWLLKKKAPGIYRVHEHPADTRIDDLRQFLDLSGYSLPPGVITSSHLNRVLRASDGKPEQHLVHTSILRSQMQAFYSHENLGHFGLSLKRYAHFTSPIRRYSDLIVHRSLAALIDGQKSPVDLKTLPEVAVHISDTERKAMMAERDASDRYKVSFMARQIGNTFPGTITGLNEYGLFVTLADNGVTGFIPVRNLGGDFFRYDKKHACFKAARGKQTYKLGEPLFVRVQEANAMTGSLIFEIERGDEPLRELSSRRRPGSTFRGKRRR